MAQGWKEDEDNKRDVLSPGDDVDSLMDKLVDNEEEIDKDE